MHILIIGSGIDGLTAAALTARTGYEATLLESGAAVQGFKFPDGGIHCARSIAPELFQL